MIFKNLSTEIYYWGVWILGALVWLVIGLRIEHLRHTEQSLVVLAFVTFAMSFTFYRISTRLKRKQ